MKITKLEHACLVIEEEDKKLIIDPGVFSPSCTDYSNVVAVVVTHVHPDHLDTDKLKAIYAQNPDVQIYTVPAVADQLEGSLPLIVVSQGQMIGIKPFELEFFGGQHALIHETIPLTDNVGVMVNRMLYYPGDSLVVPHHPVDTLAVPASAPWLKSGEAADFIAAVKPRQAFPTHNAILSDIGANIYYRLLEGTCKTVGATFVALAPADSIEIN